MGRGHRVSDVCYNGNEHDDDELMLNVLRCHEMNIYLAFNLKLTVLFCHAVSSTFRVFDVTCVVLLVKPAAMHLSVTMSGAIFNYLLLLLLLLQLLLLLLPLLLLTSSSVLHKDVCISPPVYGSGFRRSAHTIRCR